MMTPETAKRLSSFLQGRVCILGFGNRLWRDDGVGSRFAEALESCPDLDAVDGGFVPENHLEAVVRTKPDAVLLVDAADFGGTPGQISLLQPEDTALSGVSTHSGSPQMLARYLETRCGARVGLLGIQPGDTSEGDKLSEEVAAAMSELVKNLPVLTRQSLAWRAPTKTLR